MSDTAPNGRPLDHTGTLGHWRSAHRVHGWCAVCPGIEPWEELMAWRLREDARHHAARTGDQAAHTSGEGERAHG